MNEVVRKLKFKHQAVIINAPPAFQNEFIELGFTVAFDKYNKSFNTLVFVNNSKELVDFLNNQLNNIEPDSILWIAYPKLTSKIKSDIHRDTIRAAVGDYNLKTVAAISIDETWSALRLRPIDKVGV